MVINKREITAVSILGVLIVLLGLKTGLFWDNVLFVSKMGTPLFENGIFNWKSIPIDNDPGHPPFIAMLMATAWGFFGRSLLVSHWIMLPFVIGLLYQIFQFIKLFVKKSEYRVLAFILVLADPTLLSQLLLIGIEPMLLFFLVLALNSILNDNYILKTIGIALLGIVSLRGMMVCAGIFLFEFLYMLFVNQNLKKFITKQNMLSYFIASLPAILYLSWRILERGYISSHPNETFGNAWEFESVFDFFKNFTRNIVVLTHRFVDFGRLVPILFIVFVLLFKKEVVEHLKIRTLLLCVFAPTFVIYFTSVIINNPMGHRYYIASYIAIILLAFVLLEQIKYSKIIYTVVLLSLLAGNLIIYPKDISQGWDASLAHLPYWELRKEAIKDMDNNGIDINEVASFFPNYYSIDSIELNGDLRRFKGFSGNEEYVFYSNVYNLSDFELDKLFLEYKKIKTFKNRGVYIDIYKNKNDF